jgi:hypothetical protein
MADVVGQGIVIITADTTKYEAAMGGVPKTAKAAAGEVSGHFSGEFSKISSAAASMSSAVGGSFGRIGSLANSAIKPLTEVSGTLGAIGASALAVGGAALAISKLGDAAEAAEGRLVKMGAAVDPTSREDIDQYRAAHAALATELDRVTVSAGSAVDKGFAVIDSALTIDLRAVEDYAGKGLGAIADKLTEILLMAPGAKEALDQMTPDQKHLANQAAYVAMLNNQISQEPELAKQLADRIAAGLQLVHDQAKGIEIQRAAAQATKDWALADMEATAKGVVAHDQYIKTLKDEDAQRQREVAASTRYWDDLSQQTTQGVAEADAAFGDALRQISQTQRSYYAGMVTAAAQATANIAGSWASLESTIVSGFQARVDAGDLLSRKQVEQANRAIEAAETAQIAQAGITAAITTASGIASLQEAGVPPMVAIPLGVAEGAGLFAATVAGIRSHRPVDFSWTPHSTNGHSQQGYTNATDLEHDLTNQHLGLHDTKDKPDIATGDPGRAHSGNTSRTRHGSTTVTVTVSGRVGKLPRRGGRA